MVGRTLRFQPSPDSGQLLVAPSLAVASAVEEACSPFPKQWPNCCFSVLGPPQDPCPSICLVYPLALHCPFGEGNGEGNVLSHFMPPFSPSLPSSQPRTRTACPSSHALLQDPSQVPDSLSSTRTPVLSGSTAGCYHCPLWPARMDAGRRLWGLASWCQVYGAKACKDLGTTLLPLPVLGAGS